MPRMSSMSLGIRDSKPAIDVRDRSLWARDPRTSSFYGPLSESRIGEIYEETNHDFWTIIAPAIAVEHGYDADAIESAGRSNGWLTLRGTSFLDYLDADDPWSGVHDADDTAPIADGDDADPYATAAVLERDRFLRFAKAITEHGMAAAEASFVERLAAELAELRKRQAHAIVLGEN